MLLRRTPEITPVEALAGLAAGRLVLVDVREPAEVRQARVKGAKTIPLGELEDRLAELHPERPVAFVCQSGMRSARAARAARKAGLDASNVKGGVQAWARAGLPLIR